MAYGRLAFNCRPDPAPRGGRMGGGNFYQWAATSRDFILVDPLLSTYGIVVNLALTGGARLGVKTIHMVPCRMCVLAERNLDTRRRRSTLGDNVLRLVS